MEVMVSPSSTWQWFHGSEISLSEGARVRAHRQTAVLTTHWPAEPPLLVQRTGMREQSVSGEQTQDAAAQGDHSVSNG